PGGKAALHRYLFQQQIARGQVHAHQQHPLHKRLLHRSNDRAYLAMGDAFLLPSRGGFQDEALPRGPDGSPGAGCAPHIPLQAQTAEKCAECLGSHPAFEAAHKQGGYDQTDEPGAACLRLPKRRLRMASSASHCLKVSMYAAFGKAGAICQAPNALFAVCTNRVENDNALGPQSHGVGPCSEGWLKLETSALHSTRWTPACPALRRCPHLCITCLYKREGESTLY